MSQIPPDEIQFAQLAFDHGYVGSQQLAEALELYRRYQAAGGEVPSLARIMTNMGGLEQPAAEALLRHLLAGEELPPPPEPEAYPDVAEVQPEERVSRSTRPTVTQVPAPAEEEPAEAATGAAGKRFQTKPFRRGRLRSKLRAPLTRQPASAPPPASAPAPVSREAMLEGLGALILPNDLREIKNYKILSVVGEGSMGIVYKAYQISMERTVALKVLPAAKTSNPAFVDSFLAEARNAGRLNHPNLIRVHEVGKSGDTYYYSMEFVEGQRLDELMDECLGGRMEPREAMDIFVQVAAALDYGLQAGIIHREIRPNTIMLSEDGQAKLSDLGLTEDEQSRYLDGENAHYVAPEQALGKPADTRSDIYSLGCCMFHCLTGEPPFTGKGPKEVLQRRLYSPPPNPHRYNKRISPELTAVVLKMMARNPAARYQTPAELLVALRRASGYPSGTTSSGRLLRK